MDRMEQSLHVVLGPLPQRAADEGNSRSGRHSPRDVFLHSLGPGDALPDADAVIFSILQILNPFVTAIVLVVGASNSRNSVRNRRTPCLGRFRAGCEQPRCQRRQRGFQVTLRNPTS